MDKKPKDILQPLDDNAIALARKLIRTARYGSLATIEPDTGDPIASRVATATDSDGAPIILISKLTPHTNALMVNPRGSLLVGEPGKGDPLAHPRMSLSCDAVQLDRDGEDGKRAKRRFLNRHPKAALYADFGDFFFFRLEPRTTSLNGGFARAFALTAKDLLLPSETSISIGQAEQSAVEHMNDDHADAVQELAGDKTSDRLGVWKLTGIDPEGFDLANGDLVRRELFPAPLSGPEEIRTVFVEMLRSARGGGP